MMPFIGEIRKGVEVNIKSLNKYIYVVCPGCDRFRWTRLNRREETGLCFHCARSSPEVIQRQRLSVMGKNKGRLFSAAIKAKMSAAQTGKKQTDETKREHSRIAKEKIANGDWFPTIPKNPWPKPNKVEAKLLSLLEANFAGRYRYTGDGSFTINHLTPDFTNCNGHKEVIELYGDYWHKGENPEIKSNKYAEFGFRCLVIWERELKHPDNVLARIRSFQEAELKEVAHEPE